MSQARWQALWLLNSQRRGWLGKAHVSMHIRSTSLWGYLMLRSLARLRPLRPRSLRYAQEHETLQVRPATT